MLEAEYCNEEDDELFKQMTDRENHHLMKSLFEHDLEAETWSFLGCTASSPNLGKAVERGQGLWRQY